MSSEHYENTSQPRQLLADERDERLLRLVNNTGSIKLFDYVSNLLVVREVNRGDDSVLTGVLLDYLVEKRERVVEVVGLKNQFDTETNDEELGFDEDVRIALFKPLGE